MIFWCSFPHSPLHLHLLTPQKDTGCAGIWCQDLLSIQGITENSMWICGGRRLLKSHIIKLKVTQLCPTLYSPWTSLGLNTGVGSLSLLQGIFLTQKSNWGLLHCRQILKIHIIGRHQTKWNEYFLECLLYSHSLFNQQDEYMGNQIKARKFETEVVDSKEMPNIP